MTLLDRVSWLCPAAATIVVTETDHPSLGNLAWELGATYVHSPPSSGGELPVLVDQAMTALIAEAGPISQPGRVHRPGMEETGEPGS
jgi:hypothetical protein